MLKLGGIPSKNSSRAILKCTDEIHKWKAEVEENTKLPFRRKVETSSDKFPLEKLIISFFAAGSSEEQPNKTRPNNNNNNKAEFKLQFECFYSRESLFWNGNVSISIVLLTFYLGNALSFETALLCSFDRLNIFCKWVTVEL